MTKEEWIRSVVSHIDDEYQREAIARQLQEKLTKMIKQKNEKDVLHQLGDPDKYYNKHYSRKASKKFSIIVGSILTFFGALLSIITFLSANNILFEQGRFFGRANNDPLYGAGLILALGLIVLIGGLRSNKKNR